jgi:hypothetical protein
VHNNDNYDFHGNLVDGEPHGQGQKIMKTTEYDHYEFSGEFKKGAIFNGDELIRHKNGDITLYVYEEGIKVTKVTGKDGSDEELVENLKQH